MMKRVAKLMTAGSAVLMLSTAGWSQNMLPQGDFEPPVPLGGLPAGVTTSVVSATGGNSGTPWTTVTPGIGSSQGGQMSGTLSNNGAVSATLGVTPQTAAFQNGVEYTLRFTLSGSTNGHPDLQERADVSVGGTILFTGGNTSSLSGSSVRTSTNFVGTPTDYYVRFLSDGSSSLNILGTVFVNFFNSAPPAVGSILIDNISIVAAVPEVNASSAAMPLTLLLGAFLLGYDSRRKSALVGLCN